MIKTLFSALIISTASIANISPAIGQSHLKPVRPSGDGWEMKGSYCQGISPRATFCPEKQPGKRSYSQGWRWARTLPKRVKSRVTYQFTTTSIKGNSYKLRNPSFERTVLTYTINCDTWENYLDGDGWTPIKPEGLSDELALKACV